MSNQSPQHTFNQYKVRSFTTKNRTGDAYGVTLPKEVGQSFKGVKVTVEMISTQEPINLSPGEYIILKSGLDLSQLKKEIDNYNIDNY